MPGTPSILVAFVSLLVGAAVGTDDEAPAEGPRVVRLASTFGPIDVGIVDALGETYRARTGVRLRATAAGTGAALEIARRGGFDLVLTHARRLEDRFIADGFGIDRRDVMYNNFIILGPAADPAGIRGERRRCPLWRESPPARPPS